MKTTDNETNPTTPRPDIGPGDKSVAGAAGPFRASPSDWTEDFAYENGNYMCRCFTCGEQFFGYKRRVTCRVCAPPDPVAGAAQDGDVDAGGYDDGPEEIGILQARVEDQDRTIADLTRQLQGQPRRQSDVVAGAAKFALDRIREWESDNLTDGTERDWHGHVGPALARLASTLVAQPEAAAGAAQKGDSHE